MNSLSSQSSKQNTNFPLPVYLLITAAGSSSRMGELTDLRGNRVSKKEYASYKGTTVIAHNCINCLNAYSFAGVVITIPEGDSKVMKEHLSPVLKQFPDVTIHLVPGGESRQQSVYHGLNAVLERLPGEKKQSIVLIHDGARPDIDRETIIPVIRGVIEHGACAPVIPVVDALKTMDDNGIITGSVKRNHVTAIQTPQGFFLSRILDAHRKLHNLQQTDEKETTALDDTEVYSRFIGPVFTVPGTGKNRKITYIEDLS